MTIDFFHCTALLSVFIKKKFGVFVGTAANDEFLTVSPPFYGADGALLTIHLCCDIAKSFNGEAVFRANTI